MRGILYNALGACVALAAIGLKAETLDSLSRTVVFPSPSVSLTPDGLSRVSLKECMPDLQSGKPVLPVTGISFNLPGGVEVATLTLTHGPVREIPLGAPVEWGLPPRLPDDPPFPNVSPDPAIYGGESPYPDYGTPYWRSDATGGGGLLSVQVHPVRLDPLRNTLLAAESVTVTITLRAKQAAAAQRTAHIAPLSAALEPGPHTYVVIATSNLIFNAPGPWNLQALCTARARAGFTPALVTTEWIEANYAGTNAAAKIRAFVQDAHQHWGVRYLLLGGTFALLPVQKLYVSFRDIFIDRTAEIPADAIYYGCMTGTFDNNGNGRYGELTDGVNGGDVDLTAEVMVGRFPVSNTLELAHMVRKTLRYENASADHHKPHALIAEKMDLGSLVYATGYMEELRYGSTSYGLNSLGFKNSPYAAAVDSDRTLYDSDAYLWTAANVLAFLNQNLASINHIGHGATKSCFKISLSQTANLNALRAFTNDMPYFLYSQACSPGAFDTPDCFAEQMVTVSNAAFAAVMNAREGWEFANVVGGYSHRYHRCFLDAALRGTATRLGEVNEQSRRMNLALVGSASANYWRWVYYELNLFGDPATPFSAAVNPLPPEITHEPLINTFDTQTLHRVACTVEPIGIYDPDTVALVWRSSRETGVAHTQTMTSATGNLFEGDIPPQPARTRIDYVLSAKNRAGILGRWPKLGEAAFTVTDRLELDIRGSPSDYGSVTPDYGLHAFASGLVAVASAPALHVVSEDTRFANRGFFGTGSVPQSGTNLTVAFQMDTDSLLAWLWQCEYRLLLTSSIDGSSSQSFWTDQDAPFFVPPVPGTVTLSNGTALAFAEWLLDGVRTPAAPGHCAPAFGTLAMHAPHTLEARYLPATLDADTNGIPDWWEFQYFGANGHGPQSDGDADGYTLLEEYQDRTDPLVAEFIPAPPRITFTPLAEVQTRPGPFTLRAVITDTHEVSSAVVRWHRKTEAWQLTPMRMTSNDLFEAQIGAVSAPGDDFEYQLIASDPSGRSSQTDVSFLFLSYPVADTSRFHDLSFVAYPTQQIVSAYMNLYNTGNADLVWSMRFARVESITDPALPCWNRVSLGQRWQASTNRCASAPYALHSRLASSNATTGPAVRATITLPPLLIGANASLSFKYWIHSEPHQATTRAFDGGIVEYSKDYGATFQQLKGPYTHTIYGWAASPWPEGTPCLAGKGTEGWRTATFDFAKEHPEFNGFQGRVMHFRFHYGADNNTDNEGWYIDDVTVMPLVWQNGFSHSIEPTYNYTIPAGSYRRILWANLPASVDGRDDNLTVSILSNDPVNPMTSFFWRLKIRDVPLLPDLRAAQSSDGDGRVRLTTGVVDRDGEPVSLAVNWSKDSGKTWLPAALTNVLAATGTVAEVAATGTLTNLPTASDGARFTNRLSATWESAALVPPLTVSTQMLFRVTATNGYFGAAYTTARFTVDNVPPAFTPGALAVSPLSAVGPYALTPNLLTLAWPVATDAPSGSALTYRLTDQASYAPAPVHTNSTVGTTATLALSNSLDSAHAFEVVALDAAGNASAPLAATLLVLHALGDFDRDGMCTADEETAGTSATDPADCFAVAIQPVPGKPGILALDWNGSAGRRYTVEATPTLLPPVWLPLPGYTDIPGTGAPLHAELPGGQPSSFFRLKVTQP